MHPEPLTLILPADSLTRKSQISGDAPTTFVPLKYPVDVLIKSAPPLIQHSSASLASSFVRASV